MVGLCLAFSSLVVLKFFLTKIDVAPSGAGKGKKVMRKKTTTGTVFVKQRLFTAFGETVHGLGVSLLANALP